MGKVPWPTLSALRPHWLREQGVHKDLKGASSIAGLRPASDTRGSQL